MMMLIPRWMVKGDFSALYRKFGPLLTEKNMPLKTSWWNQVQQDNEKSIEIKRET